MTKTKMTWGRENPLLSMAHGADGALLETLADSNINHGMWSWSLRISDDGKPTTTESAKSPCSM